MGIRLYLAMTREELTHCPALPEHPGWMACHFSPYGRGLTDLPEKLPPGALLLCDDRIPILHHDEALVARQLAETAARLHCGGILLDFQQPGCEKIAARLEELSPCPVAVPPAYAAHSKGPVLLPPPKLWEPVEKAASGWKGRELWMEWAPQAVQITVTAQGSAVSVLDKAPETQKGDFYDEALCCRYRLALAQTHAVFLLWDDAETLARKQGATEQAGITTLVGLYQQFKG